MKNVFVYLVGPPGVGKFTVGGILSERMPARLVDNHYWLNPIFGLVEQDGLTPLSGLVWEPVRQVRRAVLDAVAHLSPRDWNFVATHAALGDSEDREIADEILDAAECRQADILVVLLTCAPNELASRVTAAGRRERMKDVDAVAARRNATLPPFDPGRGHPAVTVDTTELTPEATADRIVAAANRVRTKS